MAKPTPSDDWPDRPDAWKQADKAWETKWSDRQPDDGGEAYPEVDTDYRPGDTSAEGMTDSYGDGMRAAGPYLGLGLQIAVSMVFFVGLGLLVDRWLGTTPWGVIVGAAIGMVGIMALVLRVARDTADREQKGRS